MMEEKSQVLLDLEEKLGVEVETPYHDGNKVTNVKFTFPKEVWGDLANKEGDLLPMCCGSISTIRDVFIEAMRSDGEMSVEGMELIVANAVNHTFDAINCGHDSDHPVTKVLKVWEELHPYMDFKSGLMDSDPKSVEDALYRVSFNKIWKFCSEYGWYSLSNNWGKNAHDRAIHNKALFDILPTVKVLYEKLHEIKFPPVEGYCLVRKATNLPYETNRGFAIFDNKEEAQKTLERWIKTNQVEEKNAEVHAVRVSMEKGIELLEKVENPWCNKEKVEITEEHSSDLFQKINEIRRWNEKNVKNDKVEAILHKAIKDVQKLRM